MQPPKPMSENRPAAMQPGQVLARTLVDPVQGHALLAAGSVLTPILISKIRRLGLTEEAMECLAGSEKPEPRKAPPRIQAPETLESALYEGIDRLFEASPLIQAPFHKAWSVLRGLIPRVLQLEPVHLRDFRLQGGGAAVHPLNVMLLSLQLGVAMRLRQDELIALAQAALLHDIGTRRLGKERFKSAAINSYERRLLERHVEYGLELLDRHKDQFPPLSPAVREAIYTHHERWDGSGYPRGLKGERISLLGRIIAVADSYDAMLCDQVYRQRRLPEEAYREILDLSGEAYDPAVVRIFKRAIAPYPVDTLLRLDTGDVARVVRLGPDPCRPFVRFPGVAEPVDLARPDAPRIRRALYPRRFPRFRRVSPVTLRVPHEHGAYSGCMLNLSMGGACVALDAILEPGTTLTMELAMPGAPRLELPGMVVWATEARRKICLGLSFQPLPEPAREWMEALCRP